MLIGIYCIVVPETNSSIDYKVTEGQKESDVPEESKSLGIKLFLEFIIYD